jgi:hypothetical protein
MPHQYLVPREVGTEFTTVPSLGELKSQVKFDSGTAVGAGVGAAVGGKVSPIKIESRAMSDWDA